MQLVGIVGEIDIASFPLTICIATSLGLGNAAQRRPSKQRRFPQHVPEQSLPLITMFLQSSTNVLDLVMVLRTPFLYHAQPQYSPE